MQKCVQTSISSSSLSFILRVTKTDNFAVDHTDTDDAEKRGNAGDDHAKASVNSNNHHLLVNDIANFYMIDKLAELSCLKMKKAYQEKWNSRGWVNLTKKALRKTDNSAFRNVLAHAAAVNMGALLNEHRLKYVLDPFAIQVIRELELIQAVKIIRLEWRVAEGEIALEEYRG